MRKIALLGACIAFITTTSCKKEYTCTCVYPNSNIGTTQTKYKTSDKSDAQTQCAQLDQGAKLNGGSCALE